MEGSRRDIKLEQQRDGGMGGQSVHPSIDDAFKEGMASSQPHIGFTHFVRLSSKSLGKDADPESESENKKTATPALDAPCARRCTRMIQTPSSRRRTRNKALAGLLLLPGDKPHTLSLSLLISPIHTQGVRGPAPH